MDTRTLAHFIYIGNTGLPSFYQQCLNSFQKRHPKWIIKVWTTRDANSILLNENYDYTLNDTFINRYNFVKYHILAKEGGWFIDLDIIWKKSINEIYTDKLKTVSFPDLFIPVRSLPRQKEINYKMNDDMLLYASKGILKGLLDFIKSRQDINLELKYEPYGPISLSRWLHSTDLNRVYLYEDEIQDGGYYCEHKNGTTWKFS